jgi:hypothetical protein
VRSQKQAFLLYPPLINKLNPLTPNSDESPSLPGKIYNVGLLNLILPTTSEVLNKSSEVLALIKLAM